MVHGTFERMALPIVVVKVRAPGQQAEVFTYALFDNGSTVTFCDSSIPKALGLTVTEVAMNLSTLQKKDKGEVMEVFSLEVSDVSGSNSHLLPMVLSRPSLPANTDSIPSMEDISGYPHLSSLALPVPDVSVVTLIIGQDNADCLLPFNTIRVSKGQPYAIQPGVIHLWPLSSQQRESSATICHVQSAKSKKGNPVGENSPATTGCELPSQGDNTLVPHQLPGQQFPVPSTEMVGQSICSDMVPESCQRMALPVVAIQVRSPGQHKQVFTYALLDSRSRATFCDANIPRALGLTSLEVTKNLGSLSKQEQHDVVETFSLEVTYANGLRSHLLPVVVNPLIAISMESIPSTKDISCYPHLAGLDLPV